MMLLQLISVYFYLRFLQKRLELLKVNIILFRVFRSFQRCVLLPQNGGFRVKETY